TPIIAVAIATHPTPASAPAAMPHVTFVPGAARNIARFADIINAKMKDQPNMRALLKAAKSDSEKLLIRIHALPNNKGEYQRLPRTKVDKAAAITAKKLMVEKSMEALL